MVAHLLDWHRRENKSEWWEYYRLRELDDDALLDERKAVSGLQFIKSGPFISEKTGKATKYDPDRIRRIINDIIQRANLYHEAGADLLFVEAPESVDQMRICSEVKGPVFANNLPSGKSPYLTAEELQDIGYAVVADATSCTYVIAKAVRELFTEMARTGSSLSMAERMILFDDFNRLVGLPEIRERERYYYSGFY